MSNTNTYRVVVYGQPTRRGNRTILVENFYSSTNTREELSLHFKQKYSPLTVEVDTVQSFDLSVPIAEKLEPIKMEQEQEERLPRKVIFLKEVKVSVNPSLTIAYHKAEEEISAAQSKLITAKENIEKQIKSTHPFISRVDKLDVGESIAYATVSIDMTKDYTKDFEEKT